MDKKEGKNLKIVYRKTERELSPEEYARLDGILDSMTISELDPSNPAGISMTEQFKEKLMRRCHVRIEQADSDDERQYFTSLYEAIKNFPTRDNVEDTENTIEERLLKKFRAEHERIKDSPEEEISLERKKEFLIYFLQLLNKMYHLETDPEKKKKLEKEIAAVDHNLRGMLSS